MTNDSLIDKSTTLSDELREVITDALHMLLRAKALYDSNVVGNQGFGIEMQDCIHRTTNALAKLPALISSVGALEKGDQQPDDCWSQFDAWYFNKYRIVANTAEQLCATRWKAWQAAWKVRSV